MLTRLIKTILVVSINERCMNLGGIFPCCVDDELPKKMDV